MRLINIMIDSSLSNVGSVSTCLLLVAANYNTTQYKGIIIIYSVARVYLRQHVCNRMFTPMYPTIGLSLVLH